MTAIEPEQLEHVPKPQPKAESEPETQERVLPFLDHLEELRWVLIKSLIVLLVSTGICFGFAGTLVDVFTHPLTRMSEQLSGPAGKVSANLLRSLKPSEAFMVSMKAAVVAGIVISSPIIFYYIWGFVAPGLTRKERRAMVPIFVAGVGFFFLGVLLCYAVVLQLCLAFLWNYSIRMSALPAWSLEGYMSFVLTLLIAFGLAFELPVVVALLARCGLVHSRTLAKRRIYAIFIIFIVAALLPPPDIMSQILLGLPMIGLYEISILAARLIEKKS